MINLSNQYLMMIEPTEIGMLPVNDDLTRLARSVFASATFKRSFRGQHTCICGKRSDNKQWVLPDGRITNSLLEHYVACHRLEIPEFELEKLQEYQGVMHG